MEDRSHFKRPQEQATQPDEVKLLPQTKSPDQKPREETSKNGPSRQFLANIFKLKTGNKQKSMSPKKVTPKPKKESDTPELSSDEGVKVNCTHIEFSTAILLKDREELLFSAKEYITQSSWWSTSFYTAGVLSEISTFKNSIVFPIIAVKHGGWYFFFVYTLLMYIVGIPCVYFECLLGQLTQVGITKAYSRFGKGFEAIGFVLALYTLFDGLEESSKLGSESALINHALVNISELLHCSERYPECQSLHDNKKCRETNSNSSFYFNGTCENHPPLLKEIKGPIKTNLVPHKLVDLIFWLLLCFIAYFGIQVLLIVSALNVTLRALIILYLVFPGVSSDGWNRFTTGMDLTWSNSDYSNIFYSDFWLFAFLLVFDSVSLGCSGFVSLNSFRKIRDPIFVPILISVSVSILMTFCSLVLYSNASGALNEYKEYHFAFNFFQEFVEYSDGALVHVFASDSVYLVVLYGFARLSLSFASFFAPLYMTLAIARDHFYERWSWYKLMGLGLVTSIVLPFTIINAFKVGKRLYAFAGKVEVHHWCGHLVMILAFIIVMHIYGANDLFIDMCLIYKEPSHRVFHFSPAGPLMFFLWVYLVPSIIIVISTMELMWVLQAAHESKEFKGNHAFWTINILTLLLIPLWAIYHISVNLTIKEPLRYLFLPVPGHPGFDRVTVAADEMVIEEEDNNETSLLTAESPKRTTTTPTAATPKQSKSKKDGLTKSKALTNDKKKISEVAPLLRNEQQQELQTAPEKVPDNVRSIPEQKPINMEKPPEQSINSKKKENNDGITGKTAVSPTKEGTQDQANNREGESITPGMSGTLNTVPQKDTKDTE